MPELNEEQQLGIFRAYTRWFALAITFIVALPALWAFAIRPHGTMYLGIQYNFDDHMVYAAWMKQAAQGHFRFQNLFTTDAQPGLTIHLYYLVLGWISKLIGIPVAMTLARLVFTYLSIVAMGRLVEFVTDSIYSRKLSLGLGVLGGGIGWLVWHNFGVAIVRPTPDPLKELLMRRLPNDVWQPEAFFFSSAATNSLFVVSACLILTTLVCVLRAQTSKAAILPGALCFGLLMNIHSYDVLLITFTLLGFVAALMGAKQVSKEWVGRAILIGLGAVPFALYFVYVLKNDPVFQARSETLTFSPNFRQILAGYILLMIPALVALFPKEKLKLAGWGVFVVVVLGLAVAAQSHEGDIYFMGKAAWIGCYLAVLAALYLLRPQKPGLALIAAWALVGIIAPYFPALFQRKLTMMLSVPWGILAGVGIAMVLEKRERGQRNLLGALSMILLCATGVRWLGREKMLAVDNVSNTTIHSVYYSEDIGEIVNKLEPLGDQAVIGALPGIPSPSKDEQGNRIEDSFDTPAMPDLNPILVGLAGCKAYAGHWSETPDFANKRKALGQALMSDAAALKALGITHLVLPKSGLGPQHPIDSYGSVEYRGTQWALIKVN